MALPLLPRDHGPIYLETDLSRFPVEPWNTASLLVFLITAIVFARKTRLNLRRFPFLVSALPLLVIGYLGGTMYHACRCSDLWLKMDYLPISLLALYGALYFWYRLFRDHRSEFVKLSVVVLLFLLVESVTPLNMSRQARITLSYVNLAILILSPSTLHAIKQGKKEMKLLLGAMVVFGAAVTCRMLDFVPQTATVFPMGTHFLWHIFGGAAAYLLCEYVFLTSSPVQEG